MNLELATQLLNRYCDKSNTRLKDIFPVEYAGKWWNAATDGHRFMMIERTEENKTTCPDHPVPNLVSIIPEWNCYIPVETTNLIKAYESIPIIEADITYECGVCEGEGEFYHEGHTYDCKSCDEKGFIKTGRTEKITDPDVNMVIGKSSHNNKFIRDMIYDVKALHPEKITLVHHKYQTVSIFKIGDNVLIGIAPKYVDPDDDEKEVKFITVITYPTDHESN